MVKAEVQLHIGNPLIVASLFVDRLARVAPDRDGRARAAQHIEQPHFLYTDAIHPGFAHGRIWRADRDFDFVIPEAVEAPPDFAPVGCSGDACIPRRQVPIIVGSHVEPECAGSERPRGRQALSLRTEADAIAAVRPNRNLTRPNAFCHGAAIGNQTWNRVSPGLECS